MKILAHRGFSHSFPENTMIAFQSAMAVSNGFELDVHMTKDEKLVVMHDEMVDRTTNGTGWIKDFTYEEIQTLDSGSWFSSSFQNARVPRLEEVLDLVLSSDHIVNIELKNNVICYPGIEEQVIQKVKEAKMEERVIVSSFNHTSLLHLKLCFPTIQTAILYDTTISKPWIYAKYLKASAVHPFWMLASEECIAKCHENEISVRPYTVDDEEKMKWLRSLHVDGMITNVPDIAKKCLSGQ